MLTLAGVFLGQEMGCSKHHRTEDPGGQEHTVQEVPQTGKILFGHQQLQHWLPDLVWTQVIISDL